MRGMLFCIYLVPPLGELVYACNIFYKSLQMLAIFKIQNHLGRNTEIFRSVCKLMIIN